MSREHKLLREGTDTARELKRQDTETASDYNPRGDNPTESRRNQKREHNDTVERQERQRRITPKER